MINSILWHRINVIGCFFDFEKYRERAEIPCKNVKFLHDNINAYKK